MGIVGGERHMVGIPAAEGIAVGPVYAMASAPVVRERRIRPGDVSTELDRLDQAIRATEAHFDGVSAELEAQGKASALELVNVYRLMLNSPEIAGEARRKVRMLLGADWAVRQAADAMKSKFDEMADAYFQERGRDVQSVGEHLIRALYNMPGLRMGNGSLKGGVAVAFDFSPLEVARLEAGGIAGFVTETGGPSSHAAILARSYGLPFVVGVVNGPALLSPASQAVVDGTRGIVVANPTPATLEEFHRLRERSARRCKASDSATQPCTTADGLGVTLLANIGKLDQIPKALALGAQGIGLFRTEFLYLDRLDLPTEEEQFRDACAALSAVDGRPITFRTLDLGGDKLPLAVEIPEGHNPALGVRAIRFSFQREDIFRTQLRALHRAASRGPLRIMFPLITGVSELLHALRIADSVKEELRREGIPHAVVPIGVMLETPSAVMTADHLARHCDFLSIGTNDLIQYAFAADRDNRDVGHLYHPLHPAVLRLLKLAIDGATLAGKPISLCGDMASDPVCAAILFGLGLREYSMAAAAIPRIKSVLRACRATQAQALAARALREEEASAVEALATRALEQALPFASDGATSGVEVISQAG
ncbi:MAG TPA: phosphoenolpyruvate--protein phosphotransferase [Polyangia bacterium]